MRVMMSLTGTLSSLQGTSLTCCFPGSATMASELMPERSPGAHRPPSPSWGAPGRASADAGFLALRSAPTGRRARSRVRGGRPTHTTFPQAQGRAISCGDGRGFDVPRGGSRAVRMRRGPSGAARRILPRGAKSGGVQPALRVNILAGPALRLGGWSGRRSGLVHVVCVASTSERSRAVVPINAQGIMGGVGKPNMLFRLLIVLRYRLAVRCGCSQADASRDALRDRPAHQRSAAFRPCARRCGAADSTTPRSSPSASSECSSCSKSAPKG